MNQWSFVIAAYVVTILAIAGLLLRSFAGMRRAEAEADKLRK
jgi:heme exporter protein CcmD